MRKTLQKLNPEAVLFDEKFDAAIIGICCVANNAPVALYSQKLIYDLLLPEMTLDEKNEYYHWHFVQLRAGEFTPVIWSDLKE